MILKKKLLASILGVFQKLLSSKVNDYLGFFLLQSIVESLQPEVFVWALPTIFRLIFQRLQGTKTGQLVKSFIIFLSIFIGKHGVDFVINQVNAVQPDIFAMVIQSLWVPYAAQIVGRVERKAVIIAMTDMLCKSDKFLIPPYAEFFGNVLNCIIGMNEGFQAEIPEEEDIVSAIGEDVEATAAGFSTLRNAIKAPQDPFANVLDPRGYLVHSLHYASKQKPGKYQPLVASSPGVHAIQTYFQQAEVPFI